MSSDRFEPFSLGEVEVLHRTDKAMLVEIEGKEAWIPFSVLHDDSPVHDGLRSPDEGELIVKQWFAEERGWA